MKTEKRQNPNRLNGRLLAVEELYHPRRRMGIQSRNISGRGRSKNINFAPIHEKGEMEDKEF